MNRPDLTDRRVTNMLDGIDVLILLDLLGGNGLKIHNWFAQTSWLFNQAIRLEEELWQMELLVTEEDALDDERYFEKESAMYLYNSGIGDDHVPFAQRGVNVLHMISYPFPAVWHDLSVSFLRMNE